MKTLAQLYFSNLDSKLEIVNIEIIIQIKESGERYHNDKKNSLKGSLVASMIRNIKLSK